MKDRKLEIGEMFVFPCSGGGSPFAGVIVTNLGQGNVPFGWFYGPFETLPDARDGMRSVGPEDFVLRSKFGVTGILSGDWEYNGTREIGDDFPLPPFKTRYISEHKKHRGLLLIEYYDPSDVLRQVGERWVDPDTPGLDSLPGRGLGGAIFIEQVLAKKFGASPSN